MQLLLASLVVCWLAIVRIRRTCGRKGHFLDFAGVAGVFLCCWPPVAWLLMGSLERQFPVTPYPSGEAESMVVLAGNIYSANPSQPETAPGFSTYLRCAHAAWLFRHWRRLPIVVSGGFTGEPGDLALARLMQRQLLAEGVPESMITTEGDSLTTYENAVNTAQMLQPKGVRRIVLVTEAFHMLRAELCFRKQGFDVVAAPCAYRTLELRSWRDVLAPGLWAVRNNAESLHEWGGLAWYKLRGRI